MLDRSQLELFHQHLIAIEQAGFGIRSQVLQSAEEGASKDYRESELLKIRLGQIVSQLPSQANANDVMTYLASHPSISKQYLYSLQRWLDSDGKIEALDHLLRDDDWLRTTRQGLSHTWLHLAIFSFFGLLAFSAVWGLSYQGIQSLVEQMRIEPPWALGLLLKLKPYFITLVLGSLACALVAAWWLRYHALYARTAASARAALDRSQLAATMAFSSGGITVQESATGLASEKPVSVSNSPLLHWACHEAPQQGLNAKNVLALTKRLFLWISHDRCRRYGVNGAKVSIAAIGGTIALGAGILLFYPLVQLLLVVIDSSGLP